MHGTEFYQPNRILLLVLEDLSDEIVCAPMTSLLVGNVIDVSKNLQSTGICCISVLPPLAICHA